MPAGIEVRNDSGFIQIVDDIKNFVLLSKGSVNLSGSQWTGGASQSTMGAHALIVIPNTLGYPPVLALRCVTSIVVYRTQLVSGNWHIDIVAQNNYALTDTVFWYAFGPTPNTVPSTVGFEVRNAAGELCYHTGYLPMRIVDFQSAAAGNNGQFSIAAGRVIAIVMLTNAWSWSSQVPAGVWQQFLYSSALLTGDNTATVNGNLQYGSVARPANYGWGGGASGSWSAMALDVTGY